VALVAPGWDTESIDLLFGTTTLAEIDGTPFALLEIPPGETFESLSLQLLAAGACTSCDPNYYIASPESQQGSIAVYEGGYSHEDYVDQDAMSRVQAPRGLGNKGHGMIVAIVDTGIDATHPDLAPRVRTDGFDFVSVDADPADDADGLDQDADGLTDEGAGHGTHIAGIVRYLAPDAELLPVRVLDSEGNGNVFALAQGIDHATGAGAHVINLSLALDGYSTVVDYMIQTANAQGIVVVASVGNDGVASATHFPASLPDVIGVAALDAADLKADFSNYGPIVAISAPGVGIMSTYLYQGYAVWNGTSMATPFLSAAAALAIRSDLAATPAEIASLLAQTADPLDHGGQAYEGQMGAGRVDVLAVILASGLGP
ncbi:S8 family serine peptidase, partial [bacterium]|nr:S8 family serine peptidase [bacterium]